MPVVTWQRVSRSVETVCNEGIVVTGPKHVRMAVARAGRYHRPLRREYAALLGDLTRSRSEAVREVARFHASDGSGYAFAAEQVRALDPSNPQLAATIAGAFNLWKRFPPQRRVLMGAALVRIAKTPQLSPDVSEVVSRTLED